MGYRGPARDYRAVTARPQEDEFGEALGRAAAQPRGGAVGIDTSYMEEQNRERERKERTAQDLAMTPGVRKGIANPYAQRPGVANSPYLQERGFKRDGENYTFDPLADAELGAKSAGMQAEEQTRARFQALSAIPGMDENKAARLVYGRSGVSDAADHEGQGPLRKALADYIRSPSRDSAAAAIMAGANLNQFPDRFALPEGESTPQRGSPEYENMLGRELQIREDVAEPRRELQRGQQRDRVSRVTGPGGEIGILNMDTGAVDWTGEKGAAPRSAGQDSPLMRALKASGPGGATAPAAGPPAAAPPGAAPAAPPAPAPAPAAAPPAAAPPASTEKKKRASADMLRDAKNDPDYRDFLIAQGYDIPKG